MLLYDLLFEADLKKINPSIKGVYAFILAYNKLVGTLFRKPLYIEFDERYKKPLLSGRTFFVSPTLAIPEMNYSAGALHDLLHGITQNIIETFSKYREINPELKTHIKRPYDAIAVGDKTLFNQQNQSRFTFKNYKVAIEEIRKVVKVIPPVYEPSYVITDIPHSIKKLSKQDRQLALSDFLKQKIFDLDKQIQIPFGIVTRFGDLMGKDYFRQKTSNNNIETSYGSVSSNPTHRIEEDIGNFVSDYFGYSVQNSWPIEDPNKLYSEIMEKVQSKIDDYSTRDNKQNSLKQVNKWKEYFIKILPPLFQEYNNQLNKLDRTLLGSEAQ